MFSNIIKSPTDPLSITGDYTVGGDLTVTGNKITFGNAEFLDNDVDGTVKLTANFFHFDSPAVATLYIDAHTGSDSKLTFIEGGSSLKWTIGNDATDDRLIIVGGSLSLGASTDRLSLNDEACLGLGKGVAAPDSDAESCLYIIKGTSPGEAVADYVYIYSKDSAGTGTDTKTTLGIYCEEGVDATALDAVATLTTRIPIWVNDTCYWLYLDPV